jgi:hypothetical protein
MPVTSAAVWVSTVFYGTVLGSVVGVGSSAFAAVEVPTPGKLGHEALASAFVYVSDYFSFVGEDAQGHVAFALDNNRGRDGDAYQAEHFVVLHDEQRGWVHLLGNGRYENGKKELLSIPNSPAFEFQGTPTTGITISSPPNHLVLRLEPVAAALSRQHERSRYWLGSASAVLQWAGRTLKGRVIYEYLFMPEFNRLTRTYWGLWKEFQGLYLVVGGEGDLYVHSQQSERIAPLVGRLAGFSVLSAHGEELKDLTLAPLRKSLALGFYRWPVEWRLEWTGRDGPMSTTLSLSDRKVIGNWVIGGFAMGIVKGAIILNGRSLPVYGLAELLM